MAAAQRAEADAFITRLPAGYDTMLTEGGGNLSGGERQRIHVARALVRHAPIVILDEPVTGLDAMGEAGVRTAFRRLVEGKTAFVVAHRLSTLAGAHKVLMLERDGTVGFGTHDRLLEESRAYRELCALQVDANMDGTGNGVAPFGATLRPASRTVNRRNAFGKARQGAA